MGKIRVSQANRGQAFEDLINFANQQYRNSGSALIHKRPTPVKVLRTQGTRIVSAVYDSKSTVDYDGCYQGKAIYFEAKSTREKTKFNLSNISSHQIEHLEKAEAQGAICFFLIEFAVFQEVYFVPLSVIRHYVNSGSKSIPYADIEIYSYEVKQTKRALLDYLVYVDKMIG